MNVCTYEVVIKEIVNNIMYMPIPTALIRWGRLIQH